MCLPDCSDGYLLDDRGYATSNHLYDPHGDYISVCNILIYLVVSYELENFDILTRSVFHFWASCQLVKLRSITSMPPTTWWASPILSSTSSLLSSVSWRLDHGNRGGALRTPQQGGVEDHHDGGHVAGEADAWLHVHHHVPLHVDLQHRHHGHDASDRFIDNYLVIESMFVLIAVDAVAMAISEDEPDRAGDDAESLHESEAVRKTSLFGKCSQTRIG